MQLKLNRPHERHPSLTTTLLTSHIPNMAPHRTPGYSPLKIFDPWFCRGVQSAIFHYATCQDYKNWKSAKERSRQAEKIAKARDAEQAVVTEQPRPIPQLQPLPFETNKGWTAEIKMGRKYDPTKTLLDRRISSGNARPRADTGDSDRYDYYRAKNPVINDQSPPIVSRLPPQERKDEVAWMKAPPPSRAVMEGRENPPEDAPQRWPLCKIERTPQELPLGNVLQNPEKAYILNPPLAKERNEEVGQDKASNRSEIPIDSSGIPLSRPPAKVLGLGSHSGWDSEPDAFLTGVRIARRGKPRISSLMAVQKGEILEIRGASHKYEMFWDDETRAHSMSRINSS